VPQVEVELGREHLGRERVGRVEVEVVAAPAGLGGGSQKSRTRRPTRTRSVSPGGSRERTAKYPRRRTCPHSAVPGTRQTPSPARGTARATSAATPPGEADRSPTPRRHGRRNARSRSRKRATAHPRKGHHPPAKNAMIWYSSAYESNG